MRKLGFDIVLLLIVLCALPQTSAASSQMVVNALKQADQGNRAQAQATIKKISDPTAQSTLKWFSYIKGAPNTSFQEIATFISRHPDWPYLDKIRLEAEKNITENIPDITIIKWFSENEPLTGSGMDRYVRALLARGKANDVRRVLKNRWADADLTREQQREFFGRYGRYLDRTGHIKRMDKLLHKKEYANASAIGGVLAGGYPALAAARQALAQGKGNVNGFINAVPSKLQRDEGLLFERLKWRRRNDLDQGAIEILNRAPRSSSMYDPAAWWKERHIIVRRLIEQRKYKQAYKLASSHKQKEGFPLAQAEWVSGWLALNFTHQPWKAFGHFEKLYKNVKSPISRARGAYWTAKASDKLKHPEIAAKWYHVGAQYRETFYGQMSADALKINGSLSRVGVPSISIAVQNKFKRKDLVQAATWLNKAGLKKEASVFLLHLSKNAQNSEDYVLAIKLAKTLGQLHVSIKIAQELQKEKDVSLNQYLYPTMANDLKNVRNVEWALVSALIRQESRYDQGAVSHAGARGLMQLMPATAREVASRNGIRHQTNWLTSRPSHNIALGSRYINQMLNRFNGNYALAAAAYNAGPGRVDRWIKQFGDPRRGQIDLIDWIELIPIYETRNYVQRVLEGVYVYRDRLKGRQSRPTTAIHVAAK